MDVAAAHHPIVALSFNPEEDPAHLEDPGNVAGLEAQALFQTAVVALALRLLAHLIQSRLSKELVLKTAIHHSPRSINKTPSRLLSVALLNNKHSPKIPRPFPESRMEHLPRTRIVREGGFRGGARGGTPRHNQWVKPTRKMNGAPGQPIPVEDSSILAQYHQRYDQLKLDRAKERQQAIKDGHMADPDQPTSLNQAITPVGTCEGMCPEFESIERIVQKMVDKCEKVYICIMLSRPSPDPDHPCQYLHPSTNALQNMEWKMLKRFRRSAAGYDEQLPSDIRTPKALLQTTNYLIRHVLGGSEPLALIHKFVWDRTRSVRNDFSVQQVTQESDVRIAVTCLERIARFHIVSLHLLSNPASEEPFDRHQEREQLNNTMLSLIYYYDDNRGRIAFPNEDEFRAYYIIFSIHDQRPDLEARVQKWPVSLLESPPRPSGHGALHSLVQYVATSSVSYLMACVAEIYFNYVRQTAIRTIWKGYCRTPISQQHRNEEWTVDELTRVLHFDDEEQTTKFLDEQGLELAFNEQGQQYLNWGSRHIESVEFSPSTEHAYSETFVENKRSGRSLVAIVLGMSIREAARMGMVDQSSLHERNAPSPKDISLDQDDSLFVSSIGNGVPEPVVEISDSPLGSESPAPNSPSIFQNSTPPTTVNIPVTTQPSALPATSQPVNPFQAPQPPNPFGSMFSGTASNESTPVTTSAATPAVPSNPFAASQTSQSQSPFQTSSSPFAFPKPTEPAEATGKEDTPAVSAAETPNPFGNFKPSQTLSNPLGSSPAPPQTSSIFTNGGLSNGTAEQSAGIPNPFASSLGQKPSETPKEAGSSTTSTSAAQQTPSFFAPTKSPFSPVEAKEPVSQNTTSTGIFAQTTKPFNFPTPQNTSQSSQLSASIGPGISFTQESSTIFESVKPPSFSGFSNPPWFAPPNDANKETKNTQAPTATPTFDFSNLSSLLRTPPVQPTSETKTKDSDEGDHEARDEPKLRKPDGAVKIDGKEKETTTAHVMSPEPSKAFTQQVDTPEEPLQLPAFSSPQNLDPPAEETEAERQANWKEFIRKTSEKQKKEAEEQAKSRKRALDESAETEKSRERSSSKVLKTSGSSESSPPAKKYSLAEAYAKALPKLPCLDRVKALIERKTPADDETQVSKPHNRQVDEDELLLNSARIAAERLRTGPKIFDPSPEYDLRRSSYSPSASYYNSPYSLSQSPRPHGYKVVHAPNVPEGLGRSMSASERRIRATGAHGLAYKELDFSQVDKRKEKRKYLNSE
ncbi:hypothetical protein N7509_005754 [Penicillium cosmopolitanum]|uniref:SAC3/GANP/THP3 conserved domain-containing protein n=1 Tax=Penicillium cosmopolitanum TaxID=1131564 RepID=A0A9W9W313_9EURO|nr:uncharacterized protein N7509_005754 [Penicillium cosmopolitanum]KAJ5397641.1 hypothetical protein N7509_005754 [Penicillium cosmopolitanum]